jgi:phage FluMu protein Com
MEKMYISCPVCGRNLSKSAGTSGTELTCPKCKTQLEFAVEDNTVHIRIVRHSDKTSA